MNTDRELLELAAKAVGYQTGHKWNRERLEMDPPVTAMVVHDAAGELVSTGWNPLDDDGQALRLAVKLRMTVINLTGLCEVMFDNNGREDAISQDDGNDGELHDDEITRRAIVRAAAEIGRSMP